MEALIDTQKGTVLFHQLVEPIVQLLEAKKVDVGHDTAEKLNFNTF